MSQSLSKNTKNYKIDNLPNFYMIHYGRNGWSQTIIVGETKTGWVIKYLSSIIS